MDVNLKFCKGCNKDKPINEFYKHKDKNGKYYYSSCYCKKCTVARRKEYLNQYVKDYKEKLKQYRAQNYQENKEKKVEYQKQYYQAHKSKKANYDKIYREKYKNIKNERELERLHNDNLYHLKKQLRQCVYSSFKRKNFCKKEYTKDIVGCDYDYFIKYLLQTYKNNYGVEWNGVEKVHIDHIIPLATAKDEQCVKTLCHYTNLQLLKAKDNLVKGSNLNYNGGN